MHATHTAAPTSPNPRFFPGPGIKAHSAPVSRGGEKGGGVSSRAPAHAARQVISGRGSGLLTPGLLSGEKKFSSLFFLGRARADDSARARGGTVGGLAERTVSGGRATGGTGGEARVSRRWIRGQGGPWGRGEKGVEGRSHCGVFENGNPRCGFRAGKSSGRCLISEAVVSAAVGAAYLGDRARGRGRLHGSGPVSHRASLSRLSRDNCRDLWSLGCSPPSPGG